MGVVSASRYMALTAPRAVVSTSPPRRRLWGEAHRYRPPSRSCQDPTGAQDASSTMARAPSRMNAMGIRSSAR